MKTMSAVLVLAGLIVLTAPLRTDSSSTPAYYSAQTYEKSLDDVQTKFENQIATLNSQIGQVNKVIFDSNQTTSLKVVALSEKMADQRNSLYNVEQLLKIPYKLKVCQCRDLSDLEKTRLAAKVNQINSNITSLEQQVAQCTGDACSNYKYIQQELKNMKAYTSSADEILNSDCCHKKYEFKQQKPLGVVDLGSNVLYKDNLKARNWYYGSTNEHDYRLQMFELTTKYNVSTCPLNRPFANYALNRCEKCKDKGAVFNLGVRSCFYCGKLSYLNESNSLCDPCPPFTLYNYTAKKCESCSPEQFLNTTSEQCEPCPKGQFWDSTKGQCSSCSDDSEYDRINKKCKPCNTTAGSYLNSQTGKCQYCPDGNMYNVNTKKCELCQGNAQFNRTLGSCVPCKINWVLNQANGKCQQCPSDSYFNTTINSCVKCPVGARFDNVLQQCIVPGGNSNNTNPTNTSTGCPSDYPHYNSYLKKCQACPSGQVFDSKTQKCIKNSNIGLCPPDKPFYDVPGHKCIPCAQGTVFNSNTYLCDPVKHRHTLKL